MYYSDIIQGDNYDHINVTCLHSQKCFPLFFTCTFNKTAVFNFHGISIALKPQVILPIQQIVSIKIFRKSSMNTSQRWLNCNRPKQYHRSLSFITLSFSLHSALLWAAHSLHWFPGPALIVLAQTPQYKHNGKGGGYLVGQSFWFYPLMSLILDFVNRVHVAQMPTLTDARKKKTPKKESKKKMKRSCCSNECTWQQCSGHTPTVSHRSQCSVLHSDISQTMKTNFASE